MYNQFVIVFGILFLNLFQSVTPRTSDELRITLANGNRLVGRASRSHDGRPIKAFMGIPYAKPPLGALRFKAPEPFGEWDGVREAVEDGPACTQRDPFTRQQEIIGSDDCLFLNVFVPHSLNDVKEELPVMVLFHGGGFQCGTSITHDPDHLLDHDVIFVTANYRLGPLGFLSTEQEDCPGNFGLKDQVLVLQWIQENINTFGGDAKRITVFGNSAGGASVTYLMMSPLSRGLFSNAIAQSGSNLAAWSQPAHPGIASKRAKALAESLNCYEPNNWANTMDCLRNVSADDITASFYDFFDWDTDPMVPFPPVVEPNLPGAFIIKHPREGHDEDSLKIPLLTGLVHDEGLMKSAAILNIPGLFENFHTNFETALPIALYYNHHDPLVETWITNKISEFYFDNNLTKDKIQNITNLFSDAWFLDAMNRYLQLRFVKKSAAPTFVYLFTHKGAASFSEVFHGGRENFMGVCHVEELQYLFPMQQRLFINALPTEDDESIRKTITKLWVDFAYTGNPTPETSDLPKWYPTQGFPLQYYRIGNYHFEGKPMFGMEKNGIFQERAEFWRQIDAHLPARNTIKDEL